MKFKDKNNLVLAISAGLIVLAIIIALIATGVEKKKEKEAASTDASNQSTVSSTIAPAITANTPGKYMVTIENGNLIMRKTPDKNAEQTHSLTKGSQVQVMATYGEWAYIQTSDKYGWANISYLQLVEKGATPKYTAGKYTVDTDSLRLREKPNTNDDTAVLYNVASGTEVEVLTVSGDWGFVQYNGYSGWLSMTYLKAK